MQFKPRKKKEEIKQGFLDGIPVLEKKVFQEEDDGFIYLIYKGYYTLNDKKVGYHSFFKEKSCRLKKQEVYDTTGNLIKICDY